MALDGQSLNLRDGWNIVAKHRKLVMMVFALVVLVVFVLTFLLTPLYKGTTRVIIEKASPDALATSIRFDRNDPEFYETQIQLIQSHAVARRVVELLSLEETYDTYIGRYERFSLLQAVSNWMGRGVSRVQAILGTSESEGETARTPVSRIDRLAAKIRGDISVETVEDSRLVNISYLSPNPEFAALVANATARAYLEETLDMKAEATRRTLSWMSKKAEEEQLNLEKAEEKIQNFMRANNLVTIENRVAVLPQQLSQVSSELVRARSQREELEALYQKVRSVANNPDAAETIPAIASDPALTTLRTQILEAEQHVMELSGKYGRKHPAMIKAASDLNVLKQKRNQEIRRIIASIKNEYELARSAERTLSSQLSQTKTEAQRVNESFIQYQALNRQLETHRQLYDALLGKIKEQSITGDSQAMVNFWIVEEARTPKSPAQPRKGLNVLMGLFVGLFGGVGLAFFTEYLDNTIKDPDEAETVLGVPVLGTVEKLGAKEILWDKVVKEPRSSFAEHYKTLRTALMLSTMDSPPGKVLITSSFSAEGKTTTAVNLSLVLAQSEKRVLLIDADMRKPRLHKVFNLSNRSGLSTFLAGRHSGKELLMQGPVSHLSIVTSGPIPPNPSELLSSKRMGALLESLQNQFDIIICDSPPLLSVTDARLLSRLFDGTILVAQGAETSYEVARRSLKLLKGVEARVLGLVINALDMAKHDYYYHQYYTAYQQEEKEARRSERVGNVSGERPSAGP